MSSQRYPEEFRIEAAKQILEHGHSVADVSRRLGVSSHSLYKWVRQQQVPAAQRSQQLSQSEELRRLKTELKRVTEERDILKNGHRTCRTAPLIRNTSGSKLCILRQNVAVSFLEAFVPVKKRGPWGTCGPSCGGASCDPD